MCKQHSQPNRNRNLATSWETSLELAGQSVDCPPFCSAFLLEGNMRKLSADGSAPVHLRLTPEELAQIDRTAELRQETRSQVIRRTLRKGRELIALEQLVEEART